MGKRIQIIVSNELESDINAVCKTNGHTPSSLGRWLFEQYIDDWKHQDLNPFIKLKSNFESGNKSAIDFNKQKLNP